MDLKLNLASDSSQPSSTSSQVTHDESRPDGAFKASLANEQNRREALKAETPGGSEQARPDNGSNQASTAPRAPAAGIKPNDTRVPDGTELAPLGDVPAEMADSLPVAGNPLPVLSAIHPAQQSLTTLIGGAGLQAAVGRGGLPIDTSQAVPTGLAEANSPDVIAATTGSSSLAPVLFGTLVPGEQVSTTALDETPLNPGLALPLATSGLGLSTPLSPFASYSTTGRSSAGMLKGPGLVASAASFSSPQSPIPGLLTPLAGFSGAGAEATLSGLVPTLEGDKLLSEAGGFTLLEGPLSAAKAPDADPALALRTLAGAGLAPTGTPLDSLSQTRPTYQLTGNAFEPGFEAELGSRIRWMAGAEQSMAEIRLNPPSLGLLEVRITTDEEGAKVSFYSQNAQTRELMEASMPRLRELLASSGLMLADAEVRHESMAGGGQQESGDRSADHTGAAAGIDQEPIHSQAVRSTHNGLVDTFI